jgi:uncharacterized lipoprotein YajG
MTIFNSTNALRQKLILASSVLLLSACANQYDFAMNESYQQVKQVQILDPDATERNNGVVLSLEGNYGRQVMLEYRKSNQMPTESKDIGSSIIDN